MQDTESERYPEPPFTGLGDREVDGHSEERFEDYAESELSSERFEEEFLLDHENPDEARHGGAAQTGILEDEDIQPFESLGDEAFTPVEILDDHETVFDDESFEQSDNEAQFFDQLAWMMDAEGAAETDDISDEAETEDFSPTNLPRPVSRSIKMELQTRNLVFRVSKSGRRKKLGRKFGPPATQFLHKGKRGRPARKGKEGTAIELQSEARGFVEFETPKWFRSWCALKKRIEEAVEITKEIERPENLIRVNGKVRTYRFPFDVSHLRRRRGFSKGLRKGETLQVDVVDPSWTAKIQVSEKLALEQFHSYMEQHLGASVANTITSQAKAIVSKANTSGIAESKLVKLTSLLAIILEYLWSIDRTVKRRTEWRESNPGKKEKVPLAKEHIYLMSRTNLSSIYRVLLSDREKGLYRRIVRKRLLLKERGLTTRSRVFPLKYKGRLPRRSGLRSQRRVTVHFWLGSIYKRRRDLLARIGGDNRAMGRFEVPSSKRKDRHLVRFEARGTRQPRGSIERQVQPASRWVEFSRVAFKEAYRRRSTSFSFLKYKPKDCP